MIFKRVTANNINTLKTLAATLKIAHNIGLCLVIASP